MSAKAIREATGKDLINRLLPSGTAAAKSKFAAVTETTDWQDLLAQNPWLKTEVRANGTPMRCFQDLTSRRQASYRLPFSAIFSR